VLAPKWTRGQRLGRVDRGRCGEIAVNSPRLLETILAYKADLFMISRDEELISVDCGWSSVEAFLIFNNHLAELLYELPRGHRELPAGLESQVFLILNQRPFPLL
jgi:hypothetical protein